MRDLTTGSITQHLIATAVPVALSTLVSLGCQLINLHFVTRTGVASTAGVNAGANVFFLFAALAQALSAGTVALCSHAIGRKCVADANVHFNQCLSLALVCAVSLTALFLALTDSYARTVGSDRETIEASKEFLHWILPGYGMSLVTVIFSSVLRSSAIVRPVYMVYTLAVLLNALLAPVLIIGWLTGVPLGAKGAGLATSLSNLIALLAMAICFSRLQDRMHIRWGLLRPRLAQWRRVLEIGLPTGSEFALTFLSMAIVYYSIRDLGAEAQAGFGIGSRVLQTIIWPGLSVAFAAGPIVGQNFGAGNGLRVIETFRRAAFICSMVMIATMLLVQWHPQALVAMFGSDDDSALPTAVVFLEAMSWTLVAQGLVYTCSITFQGIGNTMPSLISSILRFGLFSAVVLWLPTQQFFRIEQLWYTWIASVVLQAALSLWLVRMELRRRLIFVPAVAC